MHMPIIRVWKLGSLERNIIPTQAAFDKLEAILAGIKAGENADIIWGPDIQVHCIPNDGTVNVVSNTKLNPADLTTLTDQTA